MGKLKGLAAIKAHEEAAEARREAASAPKKTWFKIEDGWSAKIRPLQELDVDSPNYDSEKGQSFLAIEHQSPKPKEFWKRAECSLDDEGRCLMCEKTREAYQNDDKELGKKLKQKTRFYGNVVVSDVKDKYGKPVRDPETDEPLEPYVAILSSGMGSKSVTPTLVETAEEYGSITNRWFKVKRAGATATDTEYTALPLDVSEFDTSEFELYDLDEVVSAVPYDEQAKYFGFEDALGRDEQPERPAEPETSLDADW